MSEDTEQLARRLIAGDRRSLARAITLIESTVSGHRAQSIALLEHIAGSREPSLRIGITGTPGVGKSTLIEALGLHALQQGLKVAVLSIDPSSVISGGSILGDKTRMGELAGEADAFIRPSPAGDTLGGVHRRTRESILLLEAAGYDVIVVETVGVGQSETAVSGMTDVFVLLMQPASGDELQGMKRGIVELADLVVVNKADGELRAQAEKTVADYSSALHFLRPRDPGWDVPVLSCSATERRGVAELWQQIERFREHLVADDGLAARRAGQADDWFWSELADGVLLRLKSEPALRGELEQLRSAVSDGSLPATVAVARVLQRYLSGRAASEQDS